MSKRKKRKEADDDPLDDPVDRGLFGADDEKGESRASLAVTVLWTLTGLATLLVEFGTLAAGLILLLRKPMADDELQFFQRMFGMLYIASVAAGLLLLILTPLAHRLRDEPPPAEITWAAIAIGSLPLLTGLFFYVIG